MIPSLGAGELPTPVHDPDEVRRLAEEILSGADYAPPEPSWLERAIDWVNRQLDRIFGGDGTALPGGAGGGGSSVLTLLLLVAAAGLVVFAVRHWRRTRRRRPPAVPAVDVEVEVEEHRSARQWDEAARTAEANGNWKEGLRCRFGALVGRLVHRGALPPIPGRTVGEFRTDLRVSSPGAADEFAAAAALFERAWYGDLPTGPDEAERFAGHAGRVLEATGSPR